MYKINPYSIAKQIKIPKIPNIKLSHTLNKSFKLSKPNYNNFLKPLKQHNIQIPKLQKMKLMDSDKDKIPNLWDCRPHNPRLQDIKPNKIVHEEMKKLPIFFTGGLGFTGGGGKLYAYETKKMPKGAYKAKRRFLSTVKKRPEVIGEIKRKKPRAIIVTTKGVETTGSLGEAVPYDYGEKPRSAKPGKTKGKNIVIVRASSSGRGQRYGREDVDETAATAIHEHEHVRQFKTWEKKPKIEKRMQKGRYEKRRSEVLARKAEEKAHRKRYSSPWTKKKASDWLAGYRKMTNDEEENSYKKKKKKK